VVEDPARRDAWRTSAAYTSLPSHWRLMHISRHIPAKYRRVDVDVAVWDVVASTWMNQNSQLLLSLISIGLGAAYVTLRDMPPWFVEQNTANFYSMPDIDRKYDGRQSGDFVSLLPRSITTVLSHKPVA
jgi:hypothetical protein